jgi:AraC-like DNA-binding protein
MKTGVTIKGEAPQYFSRQVSEARRFHLRLSPGASRSLQVLSGGWELCRADYLIRRNGFPHPVVEFLAHGAGRLTVGRRRFALTPGTVFLYGPHTHYEMRTDPRFLMRKYFVIFSGREAGELFRECQLREGGVFHVVQPEQIQQIFDDLIDHGLGDYPDRDRLCGVVLHYLVMKISALAVPHGQGASRSYATYERCRQFIQQHYREQHSIQDVARSCRLDPAYLCRLFRRFGRQSPFEYLQHLRMSHAADRIQNSGKMVKEVAAELKFSDPFHFSRAFRKFYGVPPGRLHASHPQP